MKIKLKIELYLILSGYYQDYYLELLTPETMNCLEALKIE